MRKIAVFATDSILTPGYESEGSSPPFFFSGGSDREGILIGCLGVGNFAVHDQRIVPPYGGTTRQADQNQAGNENFYVTDFCS